MANRRNRSVSAKPRRDRSTPLTRTKATPVKNVTTRKKPLLKLRGKGSFKELVRRLKNPGSKTEGTGKRSDLVGKRKDLKS